MRANVMGRRRPGGVILPSDRMARGRRKTTALAIAVAACLFQPDGLRAEHLRTPPTVSRHAPAATHAGVLDEVEERLNQARADQGLLPLSTTPALRVAAGGHSQDMAGMERCTHTGSDGSRPGQRMLAAGVAVPYGEIVACGYVSPEAVVAAWMDSPGHRDIVLCAFCTQLGTGYHWDPDAFQHYWTVDFAQGGLPTEPTSLPTSTAPPGPTATDLPRVTGDTNCDLLRNIVDAQFALQYDVGLRQAASRCPLPPNSLRISTCDVDADGLCNAIDVLWLLRCSAGEQHPMCEDGPGGAVLRRGPPVSRSSEAVARLPVLAPADRFHGGTTPLRRLADTQLALGVHPIGPGVTVQVPMTLTVAAGQVVGALTGELRYDPHVGRATACTLAPGLFGTCNIAYDDDGVGTDAVRFSAIALSGLSGSVNLVQVSFLGLAGLPVSPSSGTLSPYLEVLADPEGQPLDADLVQGALVWTGPTATPPGQATATTAATASATVIASLTVPAPATVTATPSLTPTLTPSVTATGTALPPPSATASATLAATATATATTAATATAMGTASASPQATATATASPSPSATMTGTSAATATATVTPTASATAGTQASTATAAASATPPPTVTPVVGGGAGGCIGGEVFHDHGDDGWLQLPAPDYGITGVQVELWQDSDGSGQWSAADTRLAGMLSGPLGNYRFCGLAPGSYFVHIPGAEFLPGGLLEGYRSSHGNDLAGLPPSPNNGVDGDDNGRDLPEGGVATLRLDLSGAGPAPGSVDLGLALQPEPTGIGLVSAEARQRPDGVLFRWTLGRDHGLSAVHIDERRDDDTWRRLTAAPLAPEQGAWLHRGQAVPGDTTYRLLGIDDLGRTRIVAMLRPQAMERVYLPRIGR